METHLHRCWLCSVSMRYDSMHIFLQSIVIIVILYIWVYCFYKYIYLPYKKELVDLDFETSLSILKLIINTELDAYETDIFINKGSISNSNFDNYYKDITEKIIRNISPTLVNQLSLYITEDMVYVIVARATKKFLSEKITGTV